MKKIIISLLLFFAVATKTFALDVMPNDVNLKDAKTIGLYQVENSIIIYAKPDENTPVTKVIKWTKNKIEPAKLEFSDIFVVFVNSKDLALVAVTDETEDWVEIIYDTKTGAKGWIKKDDPYKFSTWYNFYSMYGKKYGLYILNGAPESVNEMRGSTEDKAKIVSTINIPTRINLNVIRGNWMLLSIMDIDRTPKTGYVRWRSDDGVKYLFPAIK